MKKEYLEGAKICTSHGVKGALKLEHLCDSASVLAKQKRVFFKMRDGSFSERRVVSASVSGKFVLMTLEGIDTREAAIAERGRILYLHRSDIPVAKGAMLLSDMIGLPVLHSESGEWLGEISDISDVAGRTIYTVKTENGDVLIPAVDEFIKEISEDGVRICPIPGFFDAADEI